MKLLLDAGNTRLKWAWWDHGFRPGGAVVHAGRSPEAALAALDLKLLPTEVWAAGVASPAVHAAMEDWAQRCNQLTPRWVTTAASACGVRCAYRNPDKLGVDRWLSLIAAFHRVRGAACVVDAGTALTLDVVDAHGQHLGGLIAPGLGAQRRGLRRETQVRSREARDAPTWLARDTDSAVAWGTLHAVIGLIERVHARVSVSVPDMACLITGGEAEQLLPHLGDGWAFEPHLVLEGLARIANEGNDHRARNA